MDLIIGEVIRRRIRDDKRRANEICKLLSMSRSNLNKIYKKTSLHTEQLARISLLLEFDFFPYVSPYQLASVSGDRIYQGEEDSPEYKPPLTRLQKCMGDLHDTQRELNTLEREVVLLREIIRKQEEVIALYKKSGGE